MGHRRLTRAILVAALAFPASLPVQAASWDQTYLNGFLSSRYSVTDEQTLFHGDFEHEGINEDGSFHGTKLGLNLTSVVNERLTVAMQWFSSIEERAYQSNVDWAFASYQLNDSATLRAGKIKYPVGLVNEFIDVGLTYPWIEAPVVIYSESPDGPQATREAFSGLSLLYEGNSGGWGWNFDLFGGQVGLENMKVKGVIGLTGRANWKDALEFQASRYTGEMNAEDPMNMMDQKTHSSTVAGIKMDWRNLVAYTEWADVTMDVEDMMGVAIGNSESWYATLGYRFFGKVLPHITVQNWDRENGNGHDITTLGVTYTLSPNAALKAEWSKIKTDGAGLFSDNDGNPTPPSGDVTMTSIALDVVF